MVRCPRLIRGTEPRGRRQWGLNRSCFRRLDVEQRIDATDGAFACAARTVKQLSGDRPPLGGEPRRIGETPSDGGCDIVRRDDLGGAAEQGRFVRAYSRLRDQLRLVDENDWTVE